MAEVAAVVIKCKLKRAGGSKIELFGKTYHFKPDEKQKDDPEAAHVCAVPATEAAAIYRFLQIKEGYELADPSAELPPKPKADPGQTIGNEKPKDPIKDKPIIISDGEKEINLTELSPEELRVLARDTFKINCHHKWSDQTVIAKIIEKTRGE